MNMKVNRNAKKVATNLSSGFPLICSTLSAHTMAFPELLLNEPFLGAMYSKPRKKHLKGIYARIKICGRQHQMFRHIDNHITRPVPTQMFLPFILGTLLPVVLIF